MKKVIARIFIVIGLMCISAGAIWVLKDMQIKSLKEDHTTEISDLTGKHNAELKNIEIDTTNVKTQYLLSEDFTAEGLKVNAIYKDGRKEELTTGFVVDHSLFDNNDVDKFSINVSYEGFFKNYVVEVLQPDSVIIELNDNKCFMGQSIESLKPVVKAVYNNGGTPIYKKVSNFKNYDFDTDSIGSKTFKFYAYGNEITASLEVVSFADYETHIREKLQAHLEEVDYENIYSYSISGTPYVQYISNTACYSKLNSDEFWIDADGKFYTKSVSDDYENVVDYGSYKNAYQEEMNNTSVNNTIKETIYDVLSIRNTDISYNEQDHTLYFEDTSGMGVTLDFDTGLLKSYGTNNVLYNAEFDIPSKDGIDFEYQIQVETNKLAALLKGQTLQDLNIKVYSVSGVDGTRTEIVDSSKIKISPVDVSQEGTYTITCEYRGRKQNISFTVYNETDFINYVFEKGYIELSKQNVIVYDYIQNTTGGRAYVSDTDYYMEVNDSGLMKVFTDENNELVSTMDGMGVVYKFSSAEDRSQLMFGEPNPKEFLMDDIYGYIFSGVTCQISASDIIITSVDTYSVETYHIDKNTLLISKIQYTDLDEADKSSLQTFQFLTEMPTFDRSGLTLVPPGEETLMVSADQVYVLTGGTYILSAKVFLIDADGVATEISLEDCTLELVGENEYRAKYGTLISDTFYVTDDDSFTYSLIYDTSKERFNLDNVYFKQTKDGKISECYWDSDSLYIKAHTNSSNYIEYWVDATGKIMIATSDERFTTIQYKSFEDATRALFETTKEKFYNEKMKEFADKMEYDSTYEINDGVCTITFTNTETSAVYMYLVDMETGEFLKFIENDSGDESEFELKYNIADFEIPALPTDVEWTQVSEITRS